MSHLYFPRENVFDNKPLTTLATSVTKHALGYDERSNKANMQHVENHRRGSHVLVTLGNSDASSATGAAYAKLDIHWCAEVATKIDIII